MARMIDHTTFLLDQVRHPPRSPKTGFVAQRLRSPLQALLDSSQVFRTQTRAPSRVSRLFQGPQSTVLELRRPTTDRLPVRSHLPRHFRLMNSFAQQLRGPQTPLF